MKKTVAAFLLAWGSGAAMAGPAPVVSDFGSGDEGWATVNLLGVPFALPDPLPVVAETGFISTRDTHSWNVFSAPGKFLGDKTAFAGGTLSLDLADSLSDPGSPWPVAIISDGVTALAAFPFATPGTAFTHFSFALTESAWRAFNPFTLSLAPVSAAQFSAVLGGLQGIYVNADFKTGGNDYARLDNVRLAAPVPEPETYVLMVAGLGALAALRRRRAGT